MHELKFTDADLKANRSGYLTESQRQDVQATVAFYQRNSRRTVWFFAILIPVLMGFGLFIEASNRTEPITTWLPGYALISVCIFLLTLAATLYLRLDNYERSREARQEIISTVEGRVKILLAPRSTWNRYPMFTLTVHRGGLSNLIFRFANDGFAQYFVDGERYRVYYIRYAPIHIALSAEHIKEK